MALPARPPEVPLRCLLQQLQQTAFWELPDDPGVHAPIIILVL
jgi:hypothetical protein